MTGATKAGRGNAAVSPVEQPKYEMPKFSSIQVPAAFQERADNGVVHITDAFKNVKVATEDATHLFQHSYMAAATGAADFNFKVVEIALTNTKSALAYTQELMEVKSLSEFIELSTAQAHKQIEATIAQIKELTALTRKVVIETAEPPKSGATEALKSKKDKRQNPGEDDLSEISPEEEVLLLHVLE